MEQWRNSEQVGRKLREADEQLKQPVTPGVSASGDRAGVAEEERCHQACGGRESGPSVTQNRSMT